MRKRTGLRPSNKRNFSSFAKSGARPHRSAIGASTSDVDELQELVRRLLVRRVTSTARSRHAGFYRACMHTTNTLPAWA